MSRAAGPQCQHVRGMPWSLCLTGGTSVSGALCLGMDQGAWCRWTVRVTCLWPFGASSRMVGAVQPSADGVGSGDPSMSYEETLAMRVISPLPVSTSRSRNWTLLRR